MVRMQQAIARFVRDERGISVTEYGLLIALIGVVVAAAVKLGGPIIVRIFQQGATDLETNMAG